MHRRPEQQTLFQKDCLHDEYGWSDSVSNLSAKLQRESIRYKEVVELADALGYDLVWQKRREK